MKVQNCFIILVVTTIIGLIVVVLHQHEYRMIDVINRQSLNMKTVQHMVDQTENNTAAVRQILLYSPYYQKPNWWFQMKANDFSKCQHSNCAVSSNESMLTSADLVLMESITHTTVDKNGKQRVKFWNFWKDWPEEKDRPKDQVWAFFSRESQVRQLSGTDLNFARYSFNYTITFQHDSDAYFPYGSVRKRSTEIESLPSKYSQAKPSNVLWIVSNCKSKERMMYYESLKKYIPVDMFGKCNKQLGDPCHKHELCTKRLKRLYKFYLAFENTKCKDYITEKFWNSLREGMVPIVMGANKEDYERVAPPHSFIHVDDFTSPKELADYIKKISNNSELYSEYHDWRSKYSILKSWPTCDICRLANEKPPKITDLVTAWNAKTQCT